MAAVPIFRRSPGPGIVLPAPSAPAGQGHLSGHDAILLFRARAGLRHLALGLDAVVAPGDLVDKALVDEFLHDPVQTIDFLRPGRLP